MFGLLTKPLVVWTDEVTVHGSEAEPVSLEDYEVVFWKVRN